MTDFNDLTLIKRRTFLAALGASVLAAGAALPVGLTREQIILWGDGEHDDTAALQALVDGQNVYTPGGLVIKADYPLPRTQAYYRITQPLRMTRSNSVLDFSGSNVTRWKSCQEAVGPFVSFGKDCEGARVLNGHWRCIEHG